MFKWQCIDIFENFRRQLLTYSFMHPSIDSFMWSFISLASIYLAAITCQVWGHNSE